MTNFEGS